MESLPKIVYGCPEKTLKPDMVQLQEKTSANCNICRNFKNIHDRNHRMSKIHQKKLTERLRIIRSKMKINLDSITVHDAQWVNKEEFYCYFCDKPVQKHDYDDAGFAVEFMGLMIHHADPHHMESVKSYLKYHGRNEKCEIFCKTKSQLEKFMAKIPEVKRKYLKKLEILNERDVRQIKETEVERQKLVEEALQSTANLEFSEGKSEGNAHKFLQPSPMIPKFKRHNTKVIGKPKIPPWLMGKPESQSHANQPSDKPVIGPTMGTLIKHVETQEKKGLPTKRLKANLKHNIIGSTKFRPAFSGIWNTGRHRKLKPNFNKK